MTVTVFRRVTENGVVSDTMNVSFPSVKLSLKVRIYMQCIAPLLEPIGKNLFIDIDR